MSGPIFLYQSSNLNDDHMYHDNFYLFETMLLNQDGLQDLSLHLDRLYRSLNTLKITPILNKVEILNLLSPLKANTYSRLRLNVTAQNIWYNTSPLSSYNQIQTLMISPILLVDSHNYLFNHKTTFYDFIREEKKKFPNCDDLILFNERDEITETTRANIYIIEPQDETIYTPPLSSGVLPGVIRQSLLGKNEYLLNNIVYKVKERIIKTNEINQNTKILLSNSLMGVKDARIL